MDAAALSLVRSRIAGILTDATAIAFTVANDGEADVECAGVRTVLARRDVNLDAGLAGHYEFSLACSAAQLAAATLEPRRTKIAIGAATYRLLAMDSDPLGASFRLHLGGLVQ